MSLHPIYSIRNQWWLSFSFSFLILLSFFSPLPQIAQAAQVTVAWDPNSETGLSGYIVHYGTLSRNYQAYTDVGNNTQATISNLQAGVTYYIAVTAYDRFANESGYSNEVVYNAPPACSFSISPTSQSFPSSGGSGTIVATGSSECPRTSISNNSWIIITSNAIATGSGTVYFSIFPNPNTSTRTGTLTIGGRVFTVIQSGASPQNLGIIGYNGAGSITNHISDSSGSYIKLMRFQATANLNVTAIYAKVLGITGAYSCAIYRDNSGSPRDLLKISSKVTNPGTGWQRFSLPSAQTIIKGQYYWLAVWSSLRSSKAGVYCQPTGGTTRRTGPLTYGTWPNPITTIAGLSNKYCIYAK